MSPAVKRLLSTYHYYYTLKKKKKFVPVNLENVTHRMPFIVIEGTEACASDWIARKVAFRINGKVYPNPPECFQNLMEPFKLGLSHLRATFKALSNYAVSQEISENIYKDPAVVDGYHCRHVAYQIARFALHHNGGKIPEFPEALYKWPLDLLKPDIIYRIKPSEATVVKRLNISNIIRCSNATTSKLMDEVYSRFNDTPIREVNGDDAPNVVALNILSHLTLMFLDVGN